MKSTFDFSTYPSLPPKDKVWTPVHASRNSKGTLGLVQIERPDERGGTEYISVQSKQSHSGACLVVELGTRLTYGLEEFYVFKAVAETLPRETYHQHPIMAVEISPAWIYISLSAPQKEKSVYDDMRDEFFETSPFPPYQYSVALYRHGVVRTEAPQRHWHRGDPYKV